MKTQEEILQRMEEIKNDDFFGFQRSDLIEYLDFENAKQYLKPEVTEQEWNEREIKSPKEKMLDYMPFAWNKANNQRGLSAARSIDHYRAWLWLDGNEELSQNIADYDDYGRPQLRQICDYLGIDYKQYVEF